LDAQFLLQAASQACFADIRFLCHQTVGVTDCLRFFDAVVTPVSLFGAGHWTTHKHDLQALDCAFQKLLRKMIRRPASVG